MKRFSFGVCLWAMTWTLWAAGLGISPAQAAEPTSPRATTTRADERTVTFCAYNLRNFLTMESVVNGETKARSKPEKEIEAVVGFLGQIQPDILGVCEIGTEEDLRTLQTRLKDAGNDLPHFEMAHGGDPTRRLGLLSRFPIVDRNSPSDLKYRIGDMILPMQRGILDATVELRPGFEIRFLGIHFKSQREVPGMDQKLMRRNEAHLLRRHIEGILGAKPDTKLLAYGDFNESKNEAAMVEIEGVPGMELSMMDIRFRDSRGQTWTHYWDAADHYSRLDYCFVNRALQGQVKKPECFIFDHESFYDGSDHRPLVMKIDRGSGKSRKKAVKAAVVPEAETDKDGASGEARQ